MLIGTSQLVEQCCLATVLVSRKTKRQKFSFLDCFSTLLYVIDSHLTKARMERCLRISTLFLLLLLLLVCLYFGNSYLLCLRQSKGKLIIPYAILNRVSHRSCLYIGYYCSGNQTHIQKMLTQRAFPTDIGEYGTLSLF